jgi:methylenetetrahydrofolate reductase (NADPH)
MKVPLRTICPQMRISVELVPRNSTDLLTDATTVRAVMPEASAFNIPDLARFSLRSWEACALTSKLMPSIPHIRAMDIPPGDEVPLARTILESGLSEVLVIQGDPPHDLSKRTYPHTSVEIIRRFKKHHPELKVFAAYDPYRQSFQDELKALARKLDAGADGIFAEMLRGQNVFWGISPVLGDRSRSYWETTNKIVFPSDFRSTLDWNREFARSALRVIRSLQANVYFMPIRVDLAKYLTGLA